MERNFVCAGWLRQAQLVVKTMRVSDGAGSACVGGIHPMIQRVSGKAATLVTNTTNAFGVYRC